MVLDADGRVDFAAGAVDRPILPRSSNKPVQATALLAAGWTPRSPAELAIGAGSHNGEDAHRDLAAAMLSACVASGWPTEGYLDRDHPLQQAIEARLGEAAGRPVTAVVVDGCGAPQHALSVTGLARGVLSLVQAADGSHGRAVADAMRAEPWFVAGTGREDTDLMRAVPGLLVKGGADGVHVAAVPGRGAVALKLDDGGERGRTPALSAALLRLGVSADVLAPWLLTPVSGGESVVGEVRAASLLTA